MRHFSAHCITYHAYRLQARAFVAGIVASLGFIAFALAARESAAMACALAATFGYGVAAGAWAVAMRFRD